MALEIKSTPVLTGEDAERFIRETEENERNPQRRKLLFSFEDIDRMMERSRKYLKEHGGSVSLFTEAGRPQRKPIVVVCDKVRVCLFLRLDVTDRLALGTLVSRALLCSQSFSKNTLKSADFPYHSIMIVQLTGYIHCFLHVIIL